METICPVELAALLKENRPIDILDIRSRPEFETAHIEGSHWLTTTEISPEAILFERELLPTEPLYLISKTGRSAQIAAANLQRLGMDNVVVLIGGMRAWRRASLPVVAGRGYAKRQEA